MSHDNNNLIKELFIHSGMLSYHKKTPNMTDGTQNFKVNHKILYNSQEKFD